MVTEVLDAADTVPADLFGALEAAEPDIVMPGAEADGSIVLSWVEGWVPAETECWRLGHSELASVEELLRSYHDCVVGFAPGTGPAEGPRRCLMWDLAHAVWQFAPVCDDADRWLGGWPSPPDRVARIAALVGGCWLGAERADEFADMVVEVIAGCARSSPPLRAPSSSSPKGDPKPARKPCVSSRKSTVRCDGSLIRVRSEEHPLGGA